MAIVSNTVKLSINFLPKALKTEFRNINEVQDITIKKLESEIDFFKHETTKPEHKMLAKVIQNAQSVKFLMEQRMLKQSW